MRPLNLPNGVKWSIHNIVIKIKLPYELKLHKFLDLFMNSNDYLVEYNPEVFPGVIVKCNKFSNITILLFKNGTMVVTGSKNLENIEKVVNELYNKFQENDLFIKKSVME